MPPTLYTPRDGVGDLNSGELKAGEFPGSIAIPGSKNLSMAIGGFIKTAVITDSDAEAMGASFTPAYLGTKRSDTDGAFSIDSTLTRLFIDGRAPARNGTLRGYIEGDLNNGNGGNLSLNMRQAYGNWQTESWTLLAGHTWSTMMDLKILPEGLTEPTVSGAIFTRQPQIRWSQILDPELTLHAAIEDPSSSDVFDGSSNPELSNTRLPDFILGMEYDKKELGHLRLNTILRDLEVELPSGEDDNEVAWGVALSGHLNLLARDRWRFSGVYGEGLGRYLVGIQSTAGSAIDPVRNELSLRENWGVMTAYEHHWTQALRSTAMLGHAEANPLKWQAGSTFESTNYAAANLMWQVLPYLTMGVEYAYGQRENKDGSDLDNHRFSVGMQIY
ncbi:MAG: DcaP family trimeric outer membrane transporter [Desulfobulbaceae bacterium]|nr:DcaP family trimeric outer membrane transporter [Desulfobulbaceae bacterium]